MALYVSLKQFEGPLDLLLHLITRAKVDIRDIFVSEITEQYLESMRGVDELDMDSASEFLAMAAMQRELSTLLGRRVDLRTPNELSRYFREDVLRQAEVIYEDSSSTEAAR